MTAVKRTKQAAVKYDKLCQEKLWTHSRLLCRIKRTNSEFLKNVFVYKDW